MDANIALPAALIGDPARAAILSALCNGRTEPASALAYARRISAQSASNHLAKLTEGGLLKVENQGRHRYYRLACHLRGGETGIVRGRDDLRKFVETVFDRTPDIRRRHRTAFFTNGKTLMWEYPRVTPDGEQMDLVEVMDVKDGLIRHHRVYWGWRGVKVLQDDEYRRR